MAEIALSRCHPGGICPHDASNGFTIHARAPGNLVLCGGRTQQRLGGNAQMRLPDVQLLPPLRHRGAEGDVSSPERSPITGDYARSGGGIWGGHDCRNLGDRQGVSGHCSVSRSWVLADGGQGRNRTTDTRIFSPLLYQLSYLAVPCIQSTSATTRRATILPARRAPDYTGTFLFERGFLARIVCCPGPENRYFFSVPAPSTFSRARRTADCRDFR